MIKGICFGLALVGFTNLFSQSSLSNDGNYVFSNIENVLVVQSTTSLWNKEFKNASSPQFTPDSKQIIFMLGDSLIFLNLQNGQCLYRSNVSSYKQSRNSDIKYVAFKIKGLESQLVLRNTFTGNEKYFKDVFD